MSLGGRLSRRISRLAPAPPSAGGARSRVESDPQETSEETVGPDVAWTPSVDDAVEERVADESRTRPSRDRAHTDDVREAVTLGKPTLDELRARMARVLGKSESTNGRPVPLRVPPEVDLPELPFVAEETPLGPVHVRARRLSAAHRFGHVGLAPARTARPEVLALLALDPSLAECEATDALFLDTETTGLSGGTGTVAFLVGLAFWDQGWVVEQILVRELGEEGPMLARVASRLAAAKMLVTFNGKSFDMPLLRTRFVLAGMPLPPEPPHLDLVHVARRLHQARGIPCKLTRLEEHVLGFVRVDDVPSGEVSGHYLHFLRTGDTRGLVAVVDHNAWDVEAMIALVALYGEPLDETRLEAPELVGIARTLGKSARPEEAMVFAERALARGGGAAALRARAELNKARGDRVAALADFERLTEQVDCPKARLELAKLYEHVKKAPALALEVLEKGTSERDEPAAKRRKRLERKVARATDDGPLFGATTPGKTSKGSSRG